MKQEREGRVPRDHLTPKERNAIFSYAAKVRRKRTEAGYWAGIALLMMEGGLTLEQAREKMYQDLVKGGDLEGAKLPRAFQDEVHPLKPDSQPPPATG